MMEHLDRKWPINARGTDPKRIVVEEISRLERELAITYQLGGSSGLVGIGVHGSSGLWKSKNRKSVVHLITSDTEDDDSSDDLYHGSTNSPTSGSANVSGGDNGNSNSINYAYSSLKKLKAKVQRNLNIYTDTYYLVPFCDIIKDKDINGHITAIALESLLEFLHCGFIAPTEELGSAQLVAESVLRTRFTGTHTQNDEMVLGMILSVMKEIIVANFKSISNETVCGIMHSSFEIALEHRLSDHLRRQAKKALQEMCRSLFCRLPEFSDIPLEYEEEALKISSGSKFLSLNTSRRSKVSVQSASAAQDAPFNPMVSSSGTGSVESLASPSANPGSTEFVNKQGIKFSEEAVPFKPTDENRSERFTTRSHDLLCIHGILSHLTQLISQNSENHSNEDSVDLGLHLLRTVFNVAVNEIGKKQSLLAIVKDQLCFNILQFVKYDRPFKTFSLAISLCLLIFIPLRIHLKYQLEVFVVKLMGIIDADNALLPYREIASEYLYVFFQDVPYLSHEQFFNYDCNIFASNLYEDVLHLLYKSCSSAHSNASNGQTNHGSFTTIQRTSFNTLLLILKSLQKAEFYSNEVILKSSNQKIKSFLDNAKGQDQELPYFINHRTSEVLTDDKNSRHESNGFSNLIDHVDIGTGKISQASPGTATNVVIDEPDLCEIAVIGREDVIGKIQHLHDQEKCSDENSPLIFKLEQVCKSIFDLPKCVSDVDNMKQRKRLLWKACEHFNTKPAKGIKFLQEHGFVEDHNDIVEFIRDNLRLDKKQIGDYLTRKENRQILKAFVGSFTFKDTRIDEALRLFQESFRLPGEAALIEPVLEEFAHHWHESNGCPFVNEDAAYSLAYAIIMLHTHQHNPSAKKDLGPMTCGQFIKNLRDMNGGQDFDPNLLRDIYVEINSNEIVLPFEQHGIIREKYLWKCLLRRSETQSGIYWVALRQKKSTDEGEPTYGETEEISSNTCEIFLKLSLLNEPTFLISWGPILSAITIIFDKVNVNQNLALTRRIVNHGFTSGAYLCAKYGHLDDLLISLCKFTKAFATGSGSCLLPPKSQLAAQCLFSIAKEYVNEIRGAWIEIMRIIIDWFIAKYLDDLLEFDDFAFGKRVQLKRQRKIKPTNRIQSDNSSNILTSLVSFFDFASLSQDNFSDYHDCYTSNSQDPQECFCGSQTRDLIVDVCKPLTIIEESKFLHPDPLTELIKALINLDLEMDDEVADDVEAFRLEMLLQIVLLNRDRASYFWTNVFNYLKRASEMCNQSEFFAERYISAIFRLAIRFIQRPDPLNEQIFQLIQHLVNTSFSETCALKLLSLMHNLHLNAGIAARSEDSEYLWYTVWCPLLNGISSMCCDSRRSVRTTALNFLHRALLNHDMRILTANQWESCFNKVLFPLLAKLLEPVDTRDPADLDQARTRAINLSCKVFLQHLQSLLQLPTFTALWLTILDFMDKYMKSEMQTDLVKEAIPESLKNVLLVMDTANCFDHKLASITWDKIHCFLPNLKEEIMPPQPSQPNPTPNFPSPVSSPVESPTENVIPPIPPLNSLNLNLNS